MSPREASPVVRKTTAPAVHIFSGINLTRARLEIGKTRKRCYGAGRTRRGLHRIIFEELADMIKTTVLPKPKAGAGVLDLLRLFRQEEAAADGYAALCLVKTKAVEPRLKAFEYLPTDTRRRPGPLSGIPVAIKDIIATSDMPTTNGSPIYKDHIPAADAWVVERLRNLGATIFGKTVSTEFAWRHPGPTVNPWNTDHTPGGSSSGSAAAVAAGLVPLALGSQTLGSVIRPAAFNGIVGLKPSFGAIPRVGVHPLSPSLDHVGFFARRVDDVALALSLLAGASDADPHGRPLPAFQVDIDRGIPPLDKPRLGIVRFKKFARAEPAQQKVFDAAIARARDAGAILEDAKATQEKWRAALPTDISGFDALLTLPAFGEAPCGLDSTGDAEYCAPWTFIGAPAVTLPAGFGPNGLPLGIQIVGRYREDLRVLRIAKWMEAALGFDPGIPGILS